MRNCEERHLVIEPDLALETVEQYDVKQLECRT